jgi:hypothetical protein
LKVIRDGKPPQVARNQQRHLFPPEGKQESDDQRTFERRSHQREQSTVCGESEGKSTEVAGEHDGVGPSGAVDHCGENERDGGRHGHRGARQVGQILPDHDRAAAHGSGKQIRDGSVFDFVGNQRCPVPDPKDRYGKPHKEQRDDDVKDVGAFQFAAIDDDAHAGVASHPPGDCQQYRAADNDHDEERPPRADHLTNSQLKDPAGAGPESSHDLTRYLNTACRLSSGDVISSMVPASRDAARVVSRV